MSESPKLEGKVAIITGAASGIGRATAILFLQHGAKTFLVDLPEQNLVDQFDDYDHARTLEIDITDADAPKKIVDGAMEVFGGVDILMNNAGIAIGADLESTTDEVWDRVMAVNVTAMFRISREAVPHMRQRGRGRIINVGSIMSDMGGPGLCAYGASKHAVAGLSKAMAVDLGQYQITVNYLQPGAIVTALSAPFFEDPEFRTYWEDKAPVGRLGQPEDVAAAALFLASDEAEFVSGVGFNVDGGAIVKF
ncbi:MAG: SDR family oxidoreductase [Gammaproteobacteria bacterium]|nr:SDR family oxidoreductase [Gammaproteobacteria bacterium]